MISDGSLEMKDAIGPTATGTGFTLTLTPSLILQVLGFVIGAFGVYYTRERIIESRLAREEAKRANDIAEKRLEWEQNTHAKTTNIQAKATTATGE